MTAAPADRAAASCLVGVLEHAWTAIRSQLGRLPGRHPRQAATRGVSGSASVTSPPAAGN
jgi:hypothetical protein